MDSIDVVQKCASKCAELARLTGIKLVSLMDHLRGGYESACKPPASTDAAEIFQLILDGLSYDILMTPLVHLNSEALATGDCTQLLELAEVLLQLARCLEERNLKGFLTTSRGANNFMPSRTNTRTDGSFIKSKFSQYGNASFLLTPRTKMLRAKLTPSQLQHRYDRNQTRSPAQHAAARKLKFYSRYSPRNYYDKVYGDALASSTREFKKLETELTTRILQQRLRRAVLVHADSPLARKGQFLAQRQAKLRQAAEKHFQRCGETFTRHRIEDIEMQEISRRLKANETRRALASQVREDVNQAYRQASRDAAAFMREQAQCSRDVLDRIDTLQHQQRVQEAVLREQLHEEERESDVVYRQVSMHERQAMAQMASRFRQNSKDYVMDHLNLDGWQT